ncbi:hypothetical protein ACWDCB_12325 [Streptomyces sp. NPDC001178]
MNSREFKELVQRAKEADAADDLWTAALLYERVHEVASAQGREDWARWALREAAGCWSVSSEPDRGLSLLMHGLHEAGPPDQESYWLHALFVGYAMHLDVVVDDIDGQLDQLSELAVDVWGDEGAITPFLQGELLGLRGDWSGALGAYERAWADRETGGPGCSAAVIASWAADAALRLARREEAQRWTELCALHARRVWERNHVAARHVNLALFDNDAPAARAASRALDAIMSRQRPVYRDVATLEAVHALLLDPGQEDPAEPAHLTRLMLGRHADEGALSFDVRYRWLRTRVCLELASLRYAAGIPPRDDIYYRQPDAMPTPDRIRLPDEMEKRLSVLHEACDIALAHAREADTRFGCSWREHEIADLRARGEHIVHAPWRQGRSH